MITTMPIIMFPSFRARQGRERQRLLAEEIARSQRRCEDANGEAKVMRKAIDVARSQGPSRWSPGARGKNLGKMVFFHRNMGMSWEKWRFLQVKMMFSRDMCGLM